MMRLLRPPHSGIFLRSFRLHSATMRAKRSQKSARCGSLRCAVPARRKPGATIHGRPCDACVAPSRRRSLVRQAPRAPSLNARFRGNVLDGAESVLGATMWDLKGKIALVTGATSGIGCAIAREIAAAGAQLMLTGRNQAAGAALANELGTRFIAGDVADPAFPDPLVAETLAAFGGLDILVNNAGITHRGSLLETSDDDWTRVMDVNVTALMRCSRAALKHMVAAGKGSIVNIASDFAVVAGQGEAVYCAS